jgi:predicted transcriptional regulator
LIATVHTSLVQLVKPPAEAGPRPAVPIDQSLARDHIVCLEDGMKFRSLKRHLAAAHGLTPAQYRERWGLPRAYPMVAPDYSRLRARVAKKTGLGGPTR